MYYMGNYFELVKPGTAHLYYLQEMIIILDSSQR